MTARQRRRVTPVFAPETVLLDPIDDRHDWRERARCVEVDPEIFFPDKGGSTRAAKQVCASCEVVAECLEDALRTDERFGIRGGKSERQRRKLRKAAAA